MKKSKSKFDIGDDDFWKNSKLGKLRLVNAPKIAAVPLESVTQSRIMKKLKSLGYLVVRNRSTNIAGWPDLTVYHKRQTFFVEVKRTPEDECTPIQLAVHAQLRELGFRVEVWDHTVLTNKMYL